jgi:recombination protein RecT
MSDTTALAKVSNYFQSEIVRERFRDVLGNREAGSYIASVMLAVADSEALQKCSLQSIYNSALRAATLRLSVDPSTGQAYLIPYKQTCTFIPGYKGYIHMAVRTNRYRYINVSKIYDGQTVTPHPISGLITLESLGGGRTSNKVAGWLAAFEMVNGFAKTLYMTIEEIHAHAKKWNPAGYNSEYGIWKKHPEEMERKTPLRILLSQWGYIDPADAAILEVVETEQDVIEGETVDPEPTTPAPEEKKTEAELMALLGYGEPAPAPITMTLDEARNVKTQNGSQLGTLSVDQLKMLVSQSKDVQRVQAAQMILAGWEMAEEAQDEAARQAANE